MRRIAAGLRYGLVAMLFYAAVRGSAASWEHLEVVGPSVGWAAAQGARLLDMPGHRVLLAWKGESWGPNHPDEAALFVVALPVGLVFIVGFGVGLLVPRRVRRELPEAEAAVEARFGRTLALGAVALALVGAKAYGFLLGFLAVVAALLARRHLPPRTPGRWLTVVAIGLGTLASLAWLFLLVTHGLIQEWLTPLQR
jgi:hypothetical protein